VLHVFLQSVYRSTAYKIAASCASDTLALHTRSSDKFNWLQILSYNTACRGTPSLRHHTSRHGLSSLRHIRWHIRGPLMVMCFKSSTLESGIDIRTIVLIVVSIMLFTVAIYSFDLKTRYLFFQCSTQKIKWSSTPSYRGADEVKSTSIRKPGQKTIEPIYLSLMNTSRHNARDTRLLISTENMQTGLSLTKTWVWEA